MGSLAFGNQFVFYGAIMKNSRRIMLVLIPLGLLVLLSPLVTLIPPRDLTGLESFLLQIISLHKDNEKFCPRAH